MLAEYDRAPPGVPPLGSFSAPADGKRYLMYHGTSAVAAAQIMAHGFKPSADGMLGRGVYLSRDLNKASRYPLDEFVLKRVVLRVVVNVGRVKKIDYQGHPLQTTWHDHGYDTAWCPPNCGMVPSGLEEDCVWDPNRIQVIGLIYPNLAVQSYFPEEPAEGKVYRMYHGTSRSAAQMIMAHGFKQSAGGMLGRGVYLSRDLNKASRYPLDLPENQRVVLRVKVNVGKVKKIDRQYHPLQKSWHDHGYDTAWCPPGCGMVKSGLEEDCVWDPNRIQVIDAIYPRSQTGRMFYTLLTYGMYCM
uniref:Grass carp reovirus (GCRV)-induced gene 2e n=1 Tax=Astyanax mexicanus TaxID=7994 RepID=A0A8B9KCI8_ASTMX